MQFGYDNDRIRIKPSFSGQKATCRLCGGTIIGKCGEVYVWHWQHHHDRECDPWQEHETVWHRNWKARFPEDWQEVIIEHSGEKHIADIQTPAGVVIEFQNSFISTSTIRIREEFYENMLWVVNAQTFKDNFHRIRSVVKQHLKTIEEDTSWEVSSLEASYDEELKEIDVEIRKNEISSEDKSSAIRWRQKRVDRLNDVFHDFGQFADAVMDSWLSDKDVGYYETSDAISTVGSEFKVKLKDIPLEIKNLQSKIRQDEEALAKVLKLEDILVNEKPLKIVPYDLISSKNYFKTKAISKESRNSFFLEVTIFTSEIEFQNFTLKKDKYDFAIDPTEKISFLMSRIETDKNTVSDLEAVLPVLREEIKNKLFEEIENMINSIKAEIKPLQEEIDELLRKKNLRLQRAEELKEEKIREVSELRNTVEKKNNDKKFKVMREKKGLYTFNWKHKRKSWEAADFPIYFDIGENYLFEQISDHALRKVFINEFLQEHLVKTSVEGILS